MLTSSEYRYQTGKRVFIYKTVHAISFSKTRKEMITDTLKLHVKHVAPFIRDKMRGNVSCSCAKYLDVTMFCE